MALKHAILAALLEGQASGYDLAKGFDASVANFWTATPQQLYRELEVMERRGLVESLLVVQQGRPNKRLFSLTQLGRELLKEFTATPAKPSAIRDDLLVQVQASDAADCGPLVESLRTRIEVSLGKLRAYLQTRERLLDGRTEKEYLRAAERIGPYLTLMRGISFEQENVTWYERAIDAIEGRLLP